MYFLLKNHLNEISLDINNNGTCQHYINTNHQKQTYYIDTTEIPEWTKKLS